MRKDNKGRNLRTGESQEASGQYRYDYKEPITGKRKTKRSWRLLKSDKTPKGKRESLSIREISEKIQSNLAKNVIDSSASVKMLVERYILSLDASYNTKETYSTLINIIKPTGFLNAKVQKIQISDAKALIGSLNVAHNTKTQIKNLLKNIFNLALEDNLILKNPFIFNIRTISKGSTEAIKAVPDHDVETILQYVKEKHKLRYNGFYVLFFTGLRISEMCGLKTCDLKGNILKVERQLQYEKGKGPIECKLKTENGKRAIPLLKNTVKVLKDAIKTRKDKNNPYIFQNNRGKETAKQRWYLAFKKIEKELNLAYPLTPHVARHTFCTNLAKMNMNPKALQMMMGHAKIATTLDYYTNYTEKEVADQFYSLFQETPFQKSVKKMQKDRKKQTDSLNNIEI